MSRTRPEIPELTLQYATGDPDTEYTKMLREAGLWPRKRGRERDDEPLSRCKRIKGDYIYIYIIKIL